MIEASKLLDDNFKIYITGKGELTDRLKKEAFGLALAEAMYYEKPAVTFTIPGSGVNYVSLDGVTGIEVENRNVEKYAEALKKLSAENRDIRDRYGKADKKRVEENFLSTQFCERIKKLFAGF